MKVLDIAWKDLIRSFRSLFFLFFGLAVPLLMSGLFYLAFGGISSDDEGFDLSATEVQVVNLDEGGFGGQLLVGILQDESLADLLHVTVVDDAASARAAVDRQEAGVAVIIPSNFTAAVTDPQGRATVEVYCDPTLTLGPGIVAGIVRQVVDGFAGSQIAVGVASERLGAAGVTVDATTEMGIAMRYAAWASGQHGENSLQVRAPASAPETSAAVRIIGPIMAAMMVMYVFYTAAASCLSLLEEQEKGTLPRLFTTPTTRAEVLGGLFISAFVLIAFQVAVLVAVSALVFGIRWGAPLPVALVTLGMIVCAIGLGILITALLKNTRQTGVIYGGVLTVAGMLGMIRVFTGNVAGASGHVFDVVSLFVPHGWAVRGWLALQQGAGVSEVLPTVAVMLTVGVAFFTFGVVRMTRRLA